MPFWKAEGGCKKCKKIGVELLKMVGVKKQWERKNGRILKMCNKLWLHKTKEMWAQPGKKEKQILKIN